MYARAVRFSKASVIALTLMTLTVALVPASASPDPPASPENAATACSGVDVPPGAFTQTLVDAQPAGTTFCIRAGVHRMAAPVVVKRGGNSFVGEPGAVLEGAWRVAYALKGACGSSGVGQNHTTVRGLEIRGFRTAGIWTGCDWITADNVIHHNHRGIQFSQGSQIRYNQIHHNSNYGVTGAGYSPMNVRIEGNEMSFNGGVADSGGSTGNSKIVAGVPGGGDDVDWIANNIHDNAGSGIWFDTGGGPATEIAGNRIERNSGPGINLELSNGGWIHDNQLLGNATGLAGKSCFWGSNIHVQNTRDLVIERNAIVTVTVPRTTGNRPAGPTNGLCLVDTDRPSAPDNDIVTGVVVRQNDVTLVAGALVGLAGMDNHPHSRTHAAFDANTYRVATLEGRYWFWEGGSAKAFLTWPQWQSRGQDSSGSASTP